MKGIVRMKGLPSTPPTRVIPDEELPYGETSYDSDDEVEDMLPPPPTNINLNHPSSPSGIAIQELPADRIDSSPLGSGNILKALWEYLTIYWRK